VQAGRGGDGAVAWRREKYVPRGGPAGGDGGSGGHVVFVADEHLSTLLDLRYRQHLRAENGRPGGRSQMNGRNGDALLVRVPVGTLVYVDATTESEGFEDENDEEDVGDDADSGGEHRERAPAVPEPGTLLGDLSAPGDELVVARGGRGGRGNIHFRSSTNRAPRRAESGRLGQAMWLRLELKLLADVGIVGFPNVGKSTLIAKTSRARPKVADYPFTTLSPQLGVVGLGEGRSFVMADVPGLIRGASDGRGLGHQFLRHLERTRVLLHLLAPDQDPERDPLVDLDAIEFELSQYGTVFENKPRVVALNKIDLMVDEDGERRMRDLRAALRTRNIPLFPICAHTGEGVQALLEAIWRRLAAARETE
jgi:GTP-binding protein